MATALRRYYRGHNLVTLREVPTAQSRVYHFDHQGTTQCLTDSTGAVTDRFASDAWGVEVRRTGSSINRQWYAATRSYSQESSRLFTPSSCIEPGRGRALAPNALVDGSIAYTQAYLTLLLQEKVYRCTLTPESVQFRKGTECGRLNWGVRFRIGRCPRHRAGFVIQRIKRSYRVKLCNPCTGLCSDELDPTNPPPVDYWEAWEVKENAKGTVEQVNNLGMERQDWADDSYTSDPFDGKCGSFEVLGTVAFYEISEAELVGLGFGKKKGGACAVAGSLYCTESLNEAQLMSLLNRQAAAISKHDARVTWNCCPKSENRLTNAGTDPPLTGKEKVPF